MAVRVVDQKVIAAGVTANGCWGTGCNINNCCCLYPTNGHRTCSQTEPPCQRAVSGCAAAPGAGAPAAAAPPPSPIHYGGHYSPPSVAPAPVAAPSGPCVSGCNRASNRNRPARTCTLPNCLGCDFCPADVKELGVDITTPLGGDEDLFMRKLSVQEVDQKVIAAGVAANGCWGTGCNINNCCCLYPTNGHRTCSQTEPPCRRRRRRPFTMAAITHLR